MSRTTKEINRITGAVISICGKLIIYALVILLLFEGATRGFAFGHEVFAAEPMAEEPGSDKAVIVEEGESDMDVARMLKSQGLIRNEFAFWIQARFYDYDFYPGTYTLNTSMTTKEMMQILSEEPNETETEETSAQTTPALSEEEQGQEETAGEQAEP